MYKNFLPTNQKKETSKVRPSQQNYSHLPTSSNCRENLYPKTCQEKNPFKNDLLLDLTSARSLTIGQPSVMTEI